MICSSLCRHPRAFALRDMLVILGVSIIAIGLASCGNQRVRDNSARTQSANNLHVMGVGLNTCAEQRMGNVPPAYGTWPAGGSTNNRAFFYYLLPFVEQNRLYEQYDPNAFVKTYYAPEDESNDGNSNSSSYAVNSSLFVPNAGARFPSCFNSKGMTNEIMLFERFSVTGYTTHTWSSVAMEGDPQVAAVEGATAGPCQFGVRPMAITMAPADRTAHAFSKAGILVCVGDASTRLMNTSANNAYTFSTKKGKDIHGTTFNWACEWKTETRMPQDGSW
jgi:hypothetical protein